MADDSFALVELLEDIFPSPERVTLPGSNPFDTYDEKKFKDGENSIKVESFLSKVTLEIRKWLSKENFPVCH